MQKDLNRSRSCRASIEQIEGFSMDQESVKKLSKQSPESLMDQDCINSYQEKKLKRLDR